MLCILKYQNGRVEKLCGQSFEDPVAYRIAVYGEAWERLRDCHVSRCTADVGQLLFDVSGDPSVTIMPSRREIAAALSLADRTMGRAFAELRELGVVEVRRHGRAPSSWRLLLTADQIGRGYE